MTEPTAAPAAPGKALARRPDTLDLTPRERYAYAQSLAEARQLPPMLRNSTADVLLRIEYGVAIGVPPVAAISAVHIVDGKPTASAGLISALIRGAGHRFRVWTEPDPDEPGELRAIAEVVRFDDPDFTYRVEWDVAKALRAKLLRRDDDGQLIAVKAGSAWDTYRGGMLKARATSEIGRDACEDVLLGVHYTAEELGARVDATGEPIIDGEVVTDSGHTPTTANPYDAPAAPAAPAEPAAAATPPADEPVTDPDLVAAAITGALSKRQLGANLVELGLANVDESKRGGFGYNGKALSELTVVVEGTAEVVTAWELIARLAPDLPDVVDGDDGNGEQEPPAGPPGDDGGSPAPDAAPSAPAAAEGRTEPRFRRSSGPDPVDPWAADPALDVMPPDDPDAPAELDACHVRGCPAPDTHETRDHVAWQDWRDANPEASGEIVDAEVVEEPDPTDRGLSPDQSPADAARAEVRRAAHAAKLAADAESAAREKPKPTARKAAARKTATTREDSPDA